MFTYLIVKKFLFYLIILSINHRIDCHWWRLWYSRNVWLLL